MKDVFFITIRLTEKDPIKLHSDENYLKLELCLQGLEIGTAISLALMDIPGIDHNIFADEKRMQACLVYSAPDSHSAEFKKFIEEFRGEQKNLISGFRELRDELTKDGIDVTTGMTAIDSLQLPA